jgi:hypothetical protein
MATPPSDETKVLFRLLADGEWHLYDDVRNEIARLIPPGKGLRRYEQNVEYKRQYRQDPSYDTSLSEDDRIFYGQRMLAQAVITSWKGRGVIFTGDGSSEPKRLKIKPGAKPWGVELPGAGDDDDGLGVEPDPEQVHAELDKLDGSSESAVASLADLDARELAEYGGMPSEGAEGVQSREEQFDELLAETVDEEVQEPAPGLDSLPAVMVQPEGFTCEGCGGFVLDADQHEGAVRAAGECGGGCFGTAVEGVSAVVSRRSLMDVVGEEIRAVSCIELCVASRVITGADRATERVVSGA